MPQHIRHSRAHPPSFPRPPTVIPAKAGTHACPGPRSGGPDSQGRPCPNTSVIPASTNRHSRAHQPSFPRRREPTPAPDSDPGARTLRADRAPTHPSFPHPFPRHSRARGNPRLPRTPIRGPGLPRQTMPQHIRHPRAHQPSFPRRREPTPAPDSGPGARTLKADHAPTHPSFPRPPTVTPAQAGTHACPGLRSGGPDHPASHLRIPFIPGPAPRPASMTPAPRQPQPPSANMTPPCQTQTSPTRPSGPATTSTSCAG